jgi:hypothetical protein
MCLKQVYMAVFVSRLVRSGTNTQTKRGRGKWSRQRYHSTVLTCAEWNACDSSGQKKKVSPGLKGGQPPTVQHITYVYAYGLTTDIMLQSHVFIFSALSVQLSNVIYYEVYYYYFLWD